MTVKEAARELEVSASLIYELVADGRLRHYRIGARGRRGKIIIPEDAIAAFREACKVGGDPE